MVAIPCVVLGAKLLQDERGQPAVRATTSATVMAQAEHAAFLLTLPRSSQKLMLRQARNLNHRPDFNGAHARAWNPCGDVDRFIEIFRID